jgi:RNA polymerase sigma factor (sigma-70 family)|tara:strand:- start:347 stop:847 length:501 start_codon:yes stop_codon:yes gene_type:complete
LAAQSEIYELYADVLFGICLKYSRNYQDAEDTLQDSFLIIFDKITQYNKKGSFEGWLKRIAINTALQKYRKKTPLELVKEVTEIEDLVEIDFKDKNLDIDFLLNLIQQLPDQYRLVFNLYVLDSYSHKEISKMLNISEGTSKSNLSRARKKLKIALETQQKREQNA